MGGSGRVDIPGISVTLAIGNTLKESLSKDEEVVVDFGTDKTFDQKELINTISGFSSRGPRSLDGLIKPENCRSGKWDYLC